MKNEWMNECRWFGVMIEYRKNRMRIEHRTRIQKREENENRNH